MVSYNAVLTNLLIKFHEKTKNVSLKVRNWQQFFFKKRAFSSKWFSGPLECSFHKRIEIFATRNLKFLAQCPRVIKIPFFQKRSFSPQSVPMETYNAVPTTLLKSFARRLKSFCSRSENESKKSFFSKKTNPNDPMAT